MKHFSPNRIHLEVEDLSKLVKLLSDAEGCVITVLPELSGFWLHSNRYETELRLLFLPGISLTVSRVRFQKRRAGTMTRLLELLKDIAAKYGLPRIVIQSVVTHEMACWCQKNEFIPAATSSFESDGDILGDYFYEPAERAEDDPAFDELLKKAMAPEASQEDLKALAEWYFAHGHHLWNGKCFRIDSEHKLYPNFKEGEDGKVTITSYNLK